MGLEGLTPSPRVIIGDYSSPVCGYWSDAARGRSSSCSSSSADPYAEERRWLSGGCTEPGGSTSIDDRDRPEAGATRLLDGARDTERYGVSPSTSSSKLVQRHLRVACLSLDL